MTHKENNGRGGFLFEATGSQATWIIRGVGVMLAVLVLGKAYLPEEPAQKQITRQEYEDLSRALLLLTQEIHAVREGINDNDEIVETLLRQIKDECLEEEAVRSWPARDIPEHTAATNYITKWLKARE